MKMKTLIFTLCLFAIQPLQAQYVPIGGVVDVVLGAENSIVLTAEAVMNWLLKNEKTLQERIQDAQTFFLKAKTIVNGALKNMRMLKEIVEIDKEIIELFDRSIEQLNQDIDLNVDGVDDLAFLDKWKHSKILLAFVGEAASVFELVKNVIEKDAFTMDDKGRIVFIEQTYVKMKKIRSAMYAHLRRINKEIFQFKRKQKEFQVYANLFKAD